MNHSDPSSASRESSESRVPSSMASSRVSDPLGIYKSPLTEATAPLDQTLATDLARLLALSTADDAPQWPSSDLTEMLRHQLATSLIDELQSLEGIDPQHLRSMIDAVTPTIRSFEDLFAHPRPPVELLQYVKEFAKACRDDPACLLPVEISSTLYYACLAVSELRCHERLTSMSSQDVKKGLDWTLKQDWMHPGLRRLFQQAYEHG